MSVYKRRISAMQALVAGTVIAKDHTVTIKNEFEEVRKVEKMKPLPRRRLLQLLHSTRALDSFLRGFTDFYGIRGSNHALGEYLNCLGTHTNPHLNKLPNGRAKYYRQKIVDRRNIYMHKAGAFPNNEQEILTLLSEMQSCLAEVASL